MSSFDLARFIDDCREALGTSDPPKAVQSIMAQALRDPAALQAALEVNRNGQGDPRQYVVLAQSPELTVMKVFCPGRLLSPPHNHLTWAVIGLYRGHEDNVFYHREGARLVEDERRTLRAPEVLVLQADAIHRIANPLPEPSYGIHVYGGSLGNPARSLWNPFTLIEEPFAPDVMLKYERELAKRGLD